MVGKVGFTLIGGNRPVRNEKGSIILRGGGGERICFVMSYDQPYQINSCFFFIFQAR